MLQINLLKRIADFFRRKDTPVPYTEQPITVYDSVVATEQEVISEHGLARWQRMPDVRLRELTNVVERIEKYYGHPTNIEVSAHQMIRAEAALIGPDGHPIELTVAFRTGEPFDQAALDRKLAAQTKEYYPDMDNITLYVQTAVKHLNFYIVEYIPLAVAPR